MQGESLSNFLCGGFHPNQLLGHLGEILWLSGKNQPP